MYLLKNKVQEYAVDIDLLIFSDNFKFIFFQLILNYSSIQIYVQQSWGVKSYKLRHKFCVLGKVFDVP